MDESPRDYLFDRIDYERRIPRRSQREEFTLATMEKLVEKLGNPQYSFPVIHVAGTKGKGSTSTMIAETLRISGYQTGLYTSPHLHRLEERFQINGEPIETSQLDRLIREVRPTVEEFDSLQRHDEPFHPPTFFEITTALAFLYFRQQSVDVAVIEVGLGGRLDSTNICVPILSVITNVGFDHTHILGNTLSSIAAEKAGIIKEGVPVIWGGEEREASEVVRRTAAERNAVLYEYGLDFGSKAVGHAPSKEPTSTQHKPSTDLSRRVACDYWADRRLGLTALPQLEVGMAGRHQQTNAAVAVATLSLLKQREWNIDEKLIRAGLAKAKIPSRVEYSTSEPRLVIDVAHNVPSMQALIDTLNEDIPEGPRVLVLGLSRDKDLPGLLTLIVEHFDRLVLTRYLGNPRAAEPEKLHEMLVAIIQKQTKPRLNLDSIVVSETPRDAVRVVGQTTQNDEWTVVAGSIFIAAEYTQSLRELKQEAVV